MTREEAIKEIKKAMPYMWKETKEAIGVLVPEFTENEDERIRKWIIDYARGQIDGYMLVDDDEAHEIAEIWKKAIAYLETQKDLFKYGRGFYYYDGEKTTYCGYPATEEKQKDYHDLYKGVSQSEWFKQNYEGKSLGEEQKPVECELEDAFKNYTDAGITVSCGDIVAKPKEQKPAEWSLSQLKMFDDILVAIGLDKAFSPERVKELTNLLNTCRLRKYSTEPTEWSEEDERKITTALFGTYAVDTATRLINKIKSLHPQPKQEWSEEDERMRSRCIRSIECSKQFAGFKTYKEAKDKEIDWLKNLSLDHKKRNEDMAKLCSNEWSEKDEEMLDAMIDMVSNSYYEPLCPREGMLAWLKSLHPQSKQEWSEEDERKRDGIIQWLCEYQAKFNPKYDSLSIESIESLIAWLKSLNPSWKPSEQEKGALRTAIHVLTEERNFPKAAEQLQAILDAFDGKKSRKHWKPSEEQIGALNYAYGELFKREDVGHNILGSLQELCDKLREL